MDDCWGALKSDADVQTNVQNAVGCLVQSCWCVK